MDKDHEQQRKELWCAVYASAVSSPDVFDRNFPDKRADFALVRFDERFTKKQDKPATPN